jgi:Polysulphide reductase, NrfD
VPPSGDYRPLLCLSLCFSTGVDEMSTEAKPQQHAGYAEQTVTKVPDWHGLVAWDMLFNSLATGLFLCAALGELLAPEVFMPVANIAYPISLALLLIDLTLLVLDLGDPLRFHHMLRVFKPSSPMSLGTWSLSIFSFPLAIAAALSVLPIMGPIAEGVRKAAVIVALLPAFASAAYKGVLLSTNSQPGWRDARWLGGYLTSSALLLGCAVLLALSVLMGQARATSILRPAVGLLLLQNMICLFLLLADLGTAVKQLSPRQRWRLGLLTTSGGMLAPLCLIFASGSPSVLLLAVLLILLGSLAIRFAIIKIPHVLSNQD